MNMPHQPEIELLLLCARPQADDDAVARIRTLLQQKLDWQLIFQLAEYHRTIPLLAFHLHNDAPDLLANDIQTKLQTSRINSTQQNLVLGMEVLHLTNLLSAEGINAVPFKGPVSAMLVYGDMAMRACGDIDLLVTQNDHRKAERALENEDYKVKTRYQDAMQSSLWHEQRQISVDLHWGIPPIRPRLDSDQLWKELKPINLLTQSVLTFSPCDTLLVTARNAVKEYWKPSLHHVSDIAALTSNYTNDDWRTAFTRAREIGCQRILIAAVLLSHRLLNLTLPSAGPTKLFNHQGINKVVDELQDHLFLNPDEQVTELLMKPKHHHQRQAYFLTLTDSLWNRSLDWLNWAITPNNADLDFITLPKALSFLYFFIRPLRLLVKRMNSLYKGTS
ncbi:nucleotidyltransferase family protein [Pseudomonadota bacterium]